MPPVSKAQQRATANYVRRTYDRIEIKVPKGQKDLVNAHAADHGESLNGFINRAIDETMTRDQVPTPTVDAGNGPAATSAKEDAST